MTRRDAFERWARDEWRNFKQLTWTEFNESDGEEFPDLVLDTGEVCDLTNEWSAFNAALDDPYIKAAAEWAEAAASLKASKYEALDAARDAFLRARAAREGK